MDLTKELFHPWIADPLALEDYQPIGLRLTIRPLFMSAGDDVDGNAPRIGGC